MKATDVLRKDHEAVKLLFNELQGTPRDNGTRRQELMDTIGNELDVHATIEEEIFYPALRSVSSLAGHAKDEHDKVKALIGDVQGRDPRSGEFEAKFAELRTAVMHHVSEEEGQMFVDAERLGETELDRLGRQLEERKQTLMTSTFHRGVRAVKQAAQKIA